MNRNSRRLFTPALFVVCAILYGASPLSAQISLGTAASFGVLGGTTVTNTGASNITGNVGVSPGSSVTGFPPGIVVGGSIHAADATAGQAQFDLTTAYNAAAGTACGVDLTGQNLGGLTLTPGVYCFTSSAFLTGTLTLNFLGNANAFFLFKIGSTLITASGSTVVVSNAGGSTCPTNLFWQVGSSATLGTGSTFAGNILALTSIGLDTGAGLNGRALARNGAVTLDTNTVAACAPAIVCPIITVNPATLPNGTVGTPYNQTVTATGGVGPYTFAVTSGALPTGLTLAAGGAITGTPTVAGTFSFTITATDTSSGCLGSRPYTVSIASPGCPVITLSPSTLPAGSIGAFYSQTITASGGSGATVFTISSGALPPGLTLNAATGAITGLPTTAGLFSFTITVTQGGCIGSLPYTITISATPACIGHCNEDSCDIASAAPAATLLLPYFEVDATAGARTTIFSVTNVSPYAQIAHVTLWTDWSFPVLDFNIFLTGYDVQPINLYDVIFNGFIGSASGGTGISSTFSPNARGTGTTGILNGINTGLATGTNPNNGVQPFSTTTSNGNPNFIASAPTNCAAGRLPGQLPGALATDVRALLTTGRSTGAGVSCPTSTGAEARVGGDHGGVTAIGYATIDVAATCSVALPIDPGYFSSEILFDNVLIGDYQDINQSTVTGNYAGGNPLVHIRAIPEGGAAGALAVATNLPFTFYDRYTIGATARTIDRRQPLPQAFAARWISGSTAAFDTQYKIWREGFTTGTGGSSGLPATAGCTDYVINATIPLTEIVRFDEHENAGVVGGTGGIIVSPPPPTTTVNTPEAVRLGVSNSLFPVVPASTDVGGWTYFNLNNGGDATAVTLTPGVVPYSATRPGFTISSVGGAAGVFPRDVSQNWVILSMFAEGRYGVDQDANWLGNGCSGPFPVTTSATTSNAIGRIAPAGGVLVCAPPNGPGTGTAPSPAASAAGQCTGSNITP